MMLMGLTDSAVSGSIYDADALSLFAAIAAATTPLTTTDKGIYNQLILDLKSASIWSGLDVFQFYAAADGVACTPNWKSPGTYDLTYNCAFSAYRGITGNGSSTDGNTNWAPSNGVNFTQNAGHVMGWNLTNRAASDSALFGAYDGGGIGVDIYSRYTSDNFYGRLNDGSGPVSNNRSDGMFIADRSSSSAVDLSRNGSSLGAATGTTTSNAPIALPIHVCGINANGSFGNHCTDELAAFSSGGALGATKRAAFYTAVYNALHAFGAV